MNIWNSKTYIEDIESVCNLDLPWQMLEGKTVLLTGASGLICSCIADILLWKNRLGAKINLIFAGRSRERTIVRFQPFEEGINYTFVYFDAASGEEPTLDRDVNYMIHGASNAHPAAYSAQPVETMLANLMGTNALLKMAADHRSDRLLFISSSEVYGQKTDGKPYSEVDYGYVDILNPRACYPSSKRAAETLCAAYSSEYGTDHVIVRPGHIYGPTMTESDSRASAQFVRNAINGEDIVMKSAGTQLRSYCYVVDCASAILTVLLKGKGGEVYNISNPDSVVTVRQMAEAAAGAGNVRLTVQEASEREKKSYNRMENSSLEARKLIELGWVGKFGIDEGMRKTVKILERIDTGRCCENP